MTSKEKKEQMFELYIDDLRYLGAEIPTLYWEVNTNGDIYLLWDSIKSNNSNNNKEYLIILDPSKKYEEWENIDECKSSK